MKSPASLLAATSCGVALTLLAMLPPPVKGAEAASSLPLPPSSDQPLAIANAKLQDGTPATIRNVLEVVRRRYPDANITAVNVDDVVIDYLTLHWGRQRGVTPQGKPAAGFNPPLLGVLSALAEASGRKFEAIPFGESDFLLRPPGEINRSSAFVTEVFNLTPFLTRAYAKPGPETQLHEVEAELRVAKTQFSDANPRIVELQNRIATLKILLEQSAKPLPKPEAFVAQIREVVEDTLNRRASREGFIELPKFQFHPGTNLLVIIGSETAVDLTRKVIAALEKNP